VIDVVSGGWLLGNVLGDNAHDDDGYGWHDAFHLAHMAVLGWSPVIRGLLGRTRKEDPATDDVEDGGRAIAIEEADHHVRLRVRAPAPMADRAPSGGHGSADRTVPADVRA